jgi:hypothetical protein
MQRFDLYRTVAGPSPSEVAGHFVLVQAFEPAVSRGEASEGGAMTADQLIERFDLAPHPEGGWFRETWRSQAGHGKRAAASAVYYVIQSGQCSHWNRVDADEMWLWHSGDPLDLSISATDEGPLRTVRLGGRIWEGEEPQLIVPAGQWQSATPVEGGECGFTFLSCVVAPAFEFAGYELAERGWSPAR